MKDWTAIERAECQKQDIPLPGQAGPPVVITGFNLVDIGHGSKYSQVRAKCYASGTDVYSDRFTLHADTWSESYLYKATVSWLAIPAGSVGILAGSCRIHPHNAGGPHPCRVDFQTSFLKVPEIFLCLNYMDFSKVWRVEASAEKITRTGFDAVFQSRGDACLWAAGGSWIAYESGRDGLEHGKIHAKWDPAGATEQSGKVDFCPAFQKVPRIFTGLTEIVSHTEFNLRVQVKVKNVTKDKFEWSIGAWGDTCKYAISAAWLAIDDTGFSSSAQLIPRQ
ncbi:hypothetical protein SISSUDRAFT_1037775 [Sistotremastrum suecicum HHB10207 ss-3]|uniref:H-type lectin domain-containing protein n=1 Tax=Sistotremastrum suecicum HHB10207 ss-3 TaxID=1314776 RepID=A0A165XNX3_9AGAM|nr:hypothetical protein SISSUDRAFT_1037775 [Sistotremastrum suecicum HHB10207 ss-3]